MTPVQTGISDAKHMVTWGQDLGPTMVYGIYYTYFWNSDCGIIFKIFSFKIIKAIYMHMFVLESASIVSYILLDVNDVRTEF